MDGQESTTLERDRGLGGAQLIADAAGRSRLQRLAVELPPQPLGPHADGGSADRKQRDEVARPSGNRHRVIRAHDRSAVVARPPFNVGTFVFGACQHQSVAEQVVEPSAITTDHDHPAAAGGQRTVEGQLEIGGVLVARMALDTGSRGGSAVERSRVDRVHVADHDVDGEVEALRLCQPSVGGDYQRGTGQQLRNRGKGGVAAGEHNRSTVPVPGCVLHSVPPLALPRSGSTGR